MFFEIPSWAVSLSDLAPSIFLSRDVLTPSIFLSSFHHAVSVSAGIAATSRFSTTIFPSDRQSKNNSQDRIRQAGVNSLLTPCQPGAPPVSVRRGVSPRAGTAHPRRRGLLRAPSSHYIAPRAAPGDERVAARKSRPRGSGSSSPSRRGQAAGATAARTGKPNRWSTPMTRALRVIRGATAARTGKAEPRGATAARTGKPNRWVRSRIPLVTRPAAVRAWRSPPAPASWSATPSGWSAASTARRTAAGGWCATASRSWSAGARRSSSPPSSRTSRCSTRPRPGSCPMRRPASPTAGSTWRASSGRRSPTTSASTSPTEPRWTRPPTSSSRPARRCASRGSAS